MEIIPSLFVFWRTSEMRSEGEDGRRQGRRERRSRFESASSQLGTDRKGEEEEEVVVEREGTNLLLLVLLASLM